MPDSWTWIDWVDIWRGMQPDQVRGIIDTAAIKDMLKNRQWTAEVRHTQDRRNNDNGVSMFCMTQYSQTYIVPYFKNAHGGPVPWCALCGKEAWGHSHIFCNKHLERALDNPYRNECDWIKPPTFQQLGLDDPQDANEGIVFATIPEDIYGASCPWPVNVRMPSHAEVQSKPHFESKIPGTDNPEGFSLRGFGVGLDWNANRGIAQEQPHTLQIEGSWQDAPQFPQVGTIHSACRPPMPHMQIPSVADPLRVEVPQIGDQHEMEQLEQWMDNMYQQGRRTKHRVRKLSEQSAAALLHFQDLEAYVVRELSTLHARQSGQDHELDEQDEWKRLSEHEWEKMITSVTDRFQGQTDQMLVLFQKIEQQQAATCLMPTVEESANTIDALRTELLTEFKKLLSDTSRKDYLQVVQENIKVVQSTRKDDQQDLLDTMRNLVMFSVSLRRHNNKQIKSRRHQNVAASTF